MSRWMPYVGCILITLTVGLSAWAEPVASVEDLNGAELPHGIVQLPRKGSSEARRLGGYIFRFSDAAFQEAPETNEKDATRSGNVFQAVRDRKLGDLTYAPINEGTFISWSGRIADLGKGFFCELDGKTLIQPPLVYSVEERSGSTGKGYEGFLEHLVEGHRYIVQTTDGKFALIRLLEKGKEGAVIQWILQPNGLRALQIPKAHLNKYAARFRASERSVNDAVAAGRGGTEDGGPASILRSEVERHVKARDRLVKRLVNEISAVPDPRKANPVKSEAVRACGELKAEEAVDVLVAQIEYMGGGVTATRALGLDSLYGCVLALQNIGKPGSRAAVAGIRDSHLFDAGGDANRRLTRIQLLTQVVVRIEGQNVARFILERELHNAGEASKPAFAQALEYLKLNP